MISDFMHAFAIVFLLCSAFSAEIEEYWAFRFWFKVLILKILPIVVAVQFIFQLCVKYQIWLN